MWKEGKSFIPAAVAEVTDMATSSALMKQVFDPSLDDILEQLEEVTANLINLNQHGHPITYNRYFIDHLQRARREELKPKLTQAIRELFETSQLTRSFVGKHPFDLVRLRDALLESAEVDTIRLEAAEALTCMRAYYKVALERFIDGIAIEVIESGLVQVLGGIFSPVTVHNMTPALVTHRRRVERELRASRAAL
ncbi:hypothetical protein BDW75DRAFT_237506 [Aspergillus navahoensis]